MIPENAPDFLLSITLFYLTAEKKNYRSPFSLCCRTYEFHIDKHQSDKINVITYFYQVDCI